MSLRYPVALLVGMCISVGLLWLMQALVIGQTAVIDRYEVSPLVEFIRLKRESETRIKERVLPKAPPKPQQLPRPKIALEPVIRPAVVSPRFSMDLDLVPDLAGGAYLGQVMAGEPDRDFIAISRIPPQYPYQASRRRIEGWVRVSFLVTEEGTVEDVVLLGAEPEGIFDRAAMRAVSRWKFKPRMVEGKPVAARAEQVVEFKLND